MSKRGNSGNNKQRRRGSSPVSKNTPDPYVNGQIPACRELLTAIQDVFPELRPPPPSSRDNNDTTSSASSSSFGQLLRWHYLEKRNARRMPPPPPLALADRNESTETSGGSNNNKKKKKRKKKKKGGAAENPGESGTSTAIPLEALAMVEGNTTSDDNKSIDLLNGNNNSNHGINIKTQQGRVSRRGSYQLPASGANSRRSSLQEAMHDSAYFFDQIQPQNSTQELLSPTQFIKQIQPEQGIPGMPSLDDDGEEDPSSSHHQEDALFSPTQFLKQMPKEETLEALPTLDIGEDGPTDNDNGGVDQDGANNNTNNGNSLPKTPRASPVGNNNNNNNSAVGTPSQPETDKSSTNTLNSPNHEWVPEETGESQQERAPGDAIRDPLTLPYLLTFSEDPGTITTKTIDGSLVSAAPPTYQEPTRMETTKVLFEEWLGQLNNNSLQGGVRDPKKDLESFVDFLQARTHGQPKQVGIPFEQLQSACSNIKSYTCRQTATAEVDKLKAACQKMVVLDASCLQEESKSQTGMSVDAAFDYVALEEGHHTPLKTEQDPAENVDLTKSVSFVLSEAANKGGAPSNNNHGNQYLYIREVSPKHLDTLTEEWLPCGIEEDVMVTTVIQDGGSTSDSALITLSTEELQQIKKRVSGKENDMKRGFRHAESSKTALHEQLDNKTSFGSASPLTKNIDFNSFPQLQRCDRQCGELMDGCVEVLKILSKENTHALADLQMQFWTTCLVALNKVLKSAKQYYKNIEQHADQNGTLPKIFVSADLREQYRELLTAKRKEWTEVCNTYERVMSIRALREFYTRISWQEFKSQSQSKTNSLDEQCFQLLDHLVNWTDTILGRRMSDIFKTRIGQTNAVLELLMKVIEPLKEQYETVERFFSTERNVYFANLRSQIVLVRSVKKQMRLLDEDEVESMVMGVLLMWRQTRIMQSRMIQSQAIPPLPLQLKKWMLQDDIGSGHWNWDTPPDGSIPITKHMNYPIGAGGKRRVMCVLAGLVYQWLGDRYKEWQAEVAEQELLTDFLAQSGRSMTNGENQSKSAKKKKKKKKKSGAAPPPQEPLDRTISTLSKDSDSGGDDSLTKPLDESSKGAEMEPSPEPEVAKPDPANEPATEAEVVQPNTPEEPIASIPEKEEEEVAIEEPPVQEEEETIPFANIDNYLSAVRVRARRRDMSAGDFLIPRMELLLADGDGNKVVIV